MLTSVEHTSTSEVPSGNVFEDFILEIDNLILDIGILILDIVYTLTIEELKDGVRY
jgi:hypothetical protein